jgi:hypothetical protein
MRGPAAEVPGLRGPPDPGGDQVPVVVPGPVLEVGVGGAIPVASTGSGALPLDPGGRPCRLDVDPTCSGSGALRMDPNVTTNQRDPNVWAPIPPAPKDP